MPKALQCAKIREIGAALISAGFVALDQQADALGLCRSTTWVILQAEHKNSGLSAAVINRMLASRRLPSPVRAQVIEYVRDKLAGRYGHSKAQLRRFAERLALPNNVAKSLGLAQPSSVANRAPVTRRMLRKAA
jgi:hypothetical protein